ncbi:MAG: GtrA family protein [Akkermansia sp.]|nr:GtrA family protein [Akkermansia sp.]
MNRLSDLILKHNSIAKFLIVGVSASAVHGAISWIFYYHIWGGRTILSTLMGYAGGWLVSYLGNRLWSFRRQAKDTAIVPSASKFIISQLAAMCVLLISTWLVQQLVILYFWWYIITNKLTLTPELEQFSTGASYPPALFVGMFLAAIVSYLMMRKFVFSK